MAVVIIRSRHEYQGLSTDDKPIGPDGSTFHSVDTGEQWVLHDEMWVMDYRQVFIAAIPPR